MEDEHFETWPQVMLYVCSMTSVQQNCLPCCKLKVNSAKKRQLGKQNKTLTCPAWQVMSSQYNSHLFNRVMGQVEVPVRQDNFRGSLPRSASNVLEPMLHPDDIHFMVVVTEGLWLAG